MRFMFIVKSAHSGPPTPELMEAMHKLADREIKAGRMLDNGGLMPLATGAQVRITDGKLSVVDGPFVEAKEVIGGYAIFELRDKEEAVASAKEFMQLHKDLMPGWEGTCELRAFASPALEASGPADAVGGHDGRRHPSRDPGRLADRAAPADHQPGEDAARCAAGRGFDAGSPVGRPRAGGPRQAFRKNPAPG